MSSLVQIGNPTSQRSKRDVTVLQFVLRLARVILGWPMRVHANRSLLRQMAGMSTYELADIGLTPADLRDTAALSIDTEVGGFLAARVEARRYARNGRRL